MKFEELTEEEQKFLMRYRALPQEKKKQLWQELALRGVVIEATDSEQAEAIRARHAGLFDEMQAAQVLK